MSGDLWVMRNREGQLELMCGAKAVSLGRNIGRITIEDAAPPPPSSQVKRAEPGVFRVVVDVKLPNLIDPRDGWLLHPGRGKPDVIDWGDEVEVMTRDGGVIKTTAMGAMWTWQGGARHAPELDVIAYRAPKEAGDDQT